MEAAKGCLSFLDLTNGKNTLNSCQRDPCRCGGTYLKVEQVLHSYLTKVDSANIPVDNGQDLDTAGWFSEALQLCQ